jgi:hypothetical protein
MHLWSYTSRYVPARIRDISILQTWVLRGNRLKQGWPTSGPREKLVRPPVTGIFSVIQFNKHNRSCFLLAQQPLVGQGLLIIDASRSHSQTHHDLYLTTYNTHKGQLTSKPCVSAHSGTSFVSPFWRLQFGPGSHIFGKILDLC